MSNSSSTIVQRLWNYCNVLRDDGMSYGDYVEQALIGKPSAIPADYNWRSLLERIRRERADRQPRQLALADHPAPARGSRPPRRS